jgi:hypothetical protein
MKKIYIIQLENVNDMERLDNGITAFENEDDAKKFYKETLDTIKKDNAEVLEDWEIEEDENSFSAYPDGMYLDNHIDLYLQEITLH